MSGRPTPALDRLAAYLEAEERRWREDAALALELEQTITRPLERARHRLEHALSDLRLTILELADAGELPTLEELE